MGRRLTLMAILSLGVPFPAIGDEAPTSRPPNVVILLADDMGFADCGVHGLKQIPTPHIDSIAANGVRCSHGYVSGPYCSPTRAGLMTGRYQQRYGHEFNPHRGKPDDLGLPISEVTFADRMKELDYVTGVLGKWHLGVTEKFHPLNRGFDEFYGFVGGARSYFPTPPPTVTEQNILAALTFRAPIEFDRKPVRWDGYLTDRLGEEAARFIQRHHEKPFFLYVAFNAVHTPMEATPEYLDRVKGVEDPRRRTYLAMLAALDDAVGTVLKAIRQADLEDDTLIIFLSDNGGPTDKYAINGSVNEPLRGGKGDTWEGGIRVPFVFQWKKRLPAGRVYDKPVIQLDLLPTAVAAAGGEIDPKWNLDGVNLLPYLSDDDDGRPHQTLYWRMGPHWAIRDGDWKIVQTYRSGEPQLFDLSQDQSESHDRREQQPQRYASLRKKWETWNAELVEPRWIDPNPDPYARNPK